VLLTWFDIILDLTSMLSLRGSLHGVYLNVGTLLLSIYRSEIQPTPDLKRCLT
jgi:hypothetical protein